MDRKAIAFTIIRKIQKSLDSTPVRLSMNRSKVIESEPMIGKKNWFICKTDCHHYLQRKADNKTGLPPKYVLCEDCSLIEWRKKENARAQN